MSGLILVSENYARAGNVTVLAGNENVQFPVGNVQNDSPSVKFRSLSNTVSIQIDLLQQRTIDFFGVFGDPANAFGITAATVKTSITTDFSASPVNTLNVYPEQDMAYVRFTPVSARYLLLEITGTGSYAEIGTVFAGTQIEFEQQNLAIESFNYAYQDLSVVRTNRYNQRFIDALPRVKSIGGELQFLNKTEQEIVDSILADVGVKLPLFMLVDKDGEGMIGGKSKLAIYGYLTSQASFSAQGGQHYSTSITVDQAT